MHAFLMPTRVLSLNVQCTSPHLILTHFEGGPMSSIFNTRKLLQGDQETSSKPYNLYIVELSSCVYKALSALAVGHFISSVAISCLAIRNETHSGNCQKRKKGEENCFLSDPMFIYANKVLKLIKYEVNIKVHKKKKVIN